MIDRIKVGYLGRTLRLAAAAVALCLMLAPRAHADLVAPASLVQNSVLVSGSHASVYSLNVSGPGVLTVKLENLSWPERLAQLNCSVFSKDGLVQALNGSAEWSFAINGPASFYASVFADAAGRFKLGLYSIKVTFQSAASLVPVPAAAWLLGSVLGMFGIRRVMPALRFAWRRESAA